MRNRKVKHSCWKKDTASHIKIHNNHNENQVRLLESPGEMS